MMIFVVVVLCRDVRVCISQNVTVFRVCSDHVKRELLLAADYILSQVVFIFLTLHTADVCVCRRLRKNIRIILTTNKDCVFV